MDLEPKLKKTKSLGHLSPATAKTLKGWADYHTKAKELHAARMASEKAKEHIRTEIGNRPSLREALKEIEPGSGSVDFTVDKDGKVNVFWAYAKEGGRRGKSVEL